MKPYTVVRDFEKALCEYTGAKFAVTVNSCTNALFLALKYHAIEWPDGWIARIPKHTYCSVPMVIIQSGGSPYFKDIDWSGSYRIGSFPIWDSARRFTSDMYIKDTFQCVSFHASKILGDTQGGCILHDNDEADKWLRKARFDGRTEGIAPKDDNFILGYHCYLSPDVAARLLLKLSVLPKINADLPNDEYPDLSKQKIFQ